jgi:tetratricopeptide (TPR) repeat protein
MALDLENTRRNADRLLKQGRLDAAFEEYRRLAEEVPRDLPLLNLVGDLASRLGRHGEAVGFYNRVAEEYAKSGFYPKAVAILKKILRYDPDRPEVLLRIGEMYLGQKLTGEARGYLLRAAERLVASRSFPEAREVYKKLVEAEPGDPLHRLRLAETLAAAGDVAGAAASLLTAAESARSAGRSVEAEKIYRRALELAPGRTDALSGLARALAAQGKVSEASALLVRELESRPDTALAGALLSVELQAGRDDEALRVLIGRFVDGFPDEMFEQALGALLSRGKGDAFWSALDPLVKRWTREATARLFRVLDRLARIEPSGHLPALERILDLQRSQADGIGATKTLGLLERAYRVRGLTDRADRVAEELREIAARVPAAEAPDAVEASTSGAAAPQRSPAKAGPANPAAPSIPGEIEAPAVPLSPGDDEFVAGRLTQAEILERYGLVGQAAEQIREITKRFPGVAAAQERLASLLRTRGDRRGQRDALVALALALRATGEVARAREVALEAESASSLEPETRQLLEGLSLLDAGAPAPAPTPRAAPPTPSAKQPAPPPKAAAPRKAEPRAPAPGDEIVIDLEGDAAASGAPAPAGAVKAPSPDDLEEVAFYLDQGMVEDARTRIRSLRARGIGGRELDALEARAASSRKAAAEEELEVEALDDGPAGPDSLLDDDTLASISEAMGMPSDEIVAAPGVAEEQSIEAIFDLFKRQVDQEVGREDHRTHYDLGIAYKEMNLLDDAVSEFEIASRAPDLFRDACSMIALCYREKQEGPEAIRWYRQALEAPGGDDEVRRGLRFDLAEVLDECGETQAALDLYRSIFRESPSYREVGQRITEIERRGR